MGVQKSNVAMPKRLILAASVAAVCGGFAAPAMADMESLLDKLRAKGVLTEEEYQEMRTEARAERREAALKKANDEEKAAKKAEGAASELTGRFKDGFSWESGDKENSIALTGRVHADYRTFSEDSTNANSADTFDIRRAYIGVQGRIAKDWTFDVTADVAQTSAPQLDVGWVNWGAYNEVQVRAGQFKMPMSIEEQTSSRFIDFQERSLVNAFVPAKERGGMIHGAAIPGLYYAVAASNGQGKNTNETSSTIDDKDVVGRVAVNVAEFIGNKDLVLHGAVAYSNGKIPGGVSPVGSGLRTEGRGMAFFQTASIGTAITEVDRTREHAELSLAWNQFKLQGETLNVNYETTTTSQDIDVNYVEAMWLITGEKYADAYRNGAYGAIKPNRAFKKGADGWGAWELGVRYTTFDAGDFTPSAGFTNKADAITVGLKWIPNTNTRVYLNYTKTDFETPVTVAGTAPGNTANDEKAITMRLGLYF
jgi:phosphate-selective porin OprO/OprP